MRLLALLITLLWVINADAITSNPVDVPISITQAATFPLSVSPNGRYLQDASGNPWLMVSDAPQAIVGDVSPTDNTVTCSGTPCDAGAFFANRKAQGINASWVAVLCAPYYTCRWNGSWSVSTQDFAGNWEFTGLLSGCNSGRPLCYDLSTPNDAYFQSFDKIVSLAAKYGIVLIASVATPGSCAVDNNNGFYGTLTNNSVAQATAYGQYLGNRYAHSPNIIWLHGNDYQCYAGDPQRAKFQAIADGIKAAEIAAGTTPKLQTIELQFQTSTSLDGSSDGWCTSPGSCRIQMNATYSYYPTYDMAYHGYAQTPTMPGWLVEADFEWKNNTGFEPNDPGCSYPSTVGCVYEIMQRKQEYWSLLAGNLGGYETGENPISTFGMFMSLNGNTGCTTSLAACAWYNPTNLNSLGMKYIGYWKALFTSLPWYALVPDSNQSNGIHAVGTSGYGTYVASCSSSPCLTSNNYVTTAKAVVNGQTWVVSYIPCGVANSHSCTVTNAFTINMASFGLAGITARWYDPTNGQFTPIATGLANSGSRVFTPTGSNSAGESDWVLVLNDNPGGSTISGVALANSGNFTTPVAANANITTISAVCSSGSCAGASFALSNSATGCTSATGNNSFTIASGTNLNAGASQVTAGSYTIGVQVTLSGATNNGACYLVSLTGTNQVITFTALHTYYISPTGSDGAAGTQAAPWATPNHAVNCGDVIVALPGVYPNTFGTWGAVSNCPSTTGGIDGAGGIYAAVLLCGGTDLASSGATSCQQTSTGGNGAFAFEGNNAHNWAVSGWFVNSNRLSRAFHMLGCPNRSDPLVHHLAFINSEVASGSFAFVLDDCGAAGAISGDYYAAVGLIVQDSASDGSCAGAISADSPSDMDTNPGTHILVYNNYLMKNQLDGNGCAIDGEAIILDSWQAHNYDQQGAILNNIAYYTTRWALNIFAGSTLTPTVYVQNNTFTASFADPITTGSSGTGSDFLVQHTGAAFDTIVYQQNNIGSAQWQFAGNGTSANSRLYASNIGGTYPNVTNGTTGSENIYHSIAGSCAGINCDPGNNQVTFGNSSMLGTNTYLNPNFNNVTDLLANHLTGPNCAGFATTTACMGWNANTQTMTSLSVISDLMGTAIGSAPYYSMVANKGFQLPSTTCGTDTNFTGRIDNGTPGNAGTTLTVPVGSVSGNPVGIGRRVTGAGVAANTVITAGSGTSWTVNNSQSVASEAMGATLYPVWLKGIVYLQWNPSTKVITEQPDLVTKPCGM